MSYLPDDVREENLNVMLAEILSERGLNALGEVILKRTKGARKEPDVLLILNGVRIFIEGKKPGQWSDLIRQCERRIDNGFCDICFMVEYEKVSTGKLNPTQTQIKESLINGIYNIGFLTYLERANLNRYTGELSEVDKYQNIRIDDLITYLMGTYSEIVKTDAIAPVVERIKSALQNFSEISESLDIERLREVLELRDSESNGE